MAATTTTAASEILLHSTAFISEIIAQPEHRHSLFTTLRHKIPLSNQLDLTIQTLENAISTTNPSIQTSSLRLAKKLLLSHSQNLFSTFLLSLIHHLSDQPLHAAHYLLQLFSLDPSLARSEIAPLLFERLFLVHLLPVVQWQRERKSSILKSLSMKFRDPSVSDDDEVVARGTKSLSKMSGNQASGLKELERRYEEILDVNCTVFANYFKGVLESGGGGDDDDDDDRFVRAPSVVIDMQSHRDGWIKTDLLGLQNGRYNVKLVLFYGDFLKYGLQNEKMI